LRNKSRGRLSESRSGRLSEGGCSLLLRNLGLREQLRMRRISRVNEGVKTSAVSTVWNRCCTWERMRSLSSRSWSTGSLSSRSLRSRSFKLSCVGVNLEIPVSWISRVDEWVDFRSLLDRSSRSKLLSLNRCLLELLLSGRSLANRSWRSTRSFTCWSNLLWLLSGNFRIKRGRVQTIGSLRYVISFQDSKSILSCRISDSDSFTIIVNVTVLTNSFTIGSSLFPEH